MNDNLSAVAVSIVDDLCDQYVRLAKHIRGNSETNPVKALMLAIADEIQARWATNKTEEAKHGWQVRNNADALDYACILYHDKLHSEELKPISDERLKELLPVAEAIARRLSQQKEKHDEKKTE